VFKAEKYFFATRWSREWDCVWYIAYLWDKLLEKNVFGPRFWAQTCHVLGLPGKWLPAGVPADWKWNLCSIRGWAPTGSLGRRRRPVEQLQGPSDWASRPRADRQRRPGYSHYQPAQRSMYQTAIIVCRATLKQKRTAKTQGGTKLPIRHLLCSRRLHRQNLTARYRHALDSSISIISKVL